MEIKSLLKSVVPLILGILIGAGLTKNKYVLGMIIFYIVFIVLFRLLADKITKVKKSSDKKLAVKDVAVEGVNEFIGTTEKGHLYGNSLFDKHYPNYIFYINMAFLFGLIFALFKKEWLWSLVIFVTLNMIVILNQVWRKVKYLDTAEYDKHIKDKIFAERIKKAEKRQLKKMGITEDGN